MKTLGEVINEWEKENKVHTNEGRRGVEGLCRLVHAMGYKDSQYFGQFAQDGSFGDLIEFLEDNSGCIEAIKDWIAERDIPEWIENLGGQSIKDCYPDGECPDCGEEIPEGIVEGAECDNCGHVFYYEHD